MCDLKQDECTECDWHSERCGMPTEYTLRGKWPMNEISWWLLDDPKEPLPDIDRGLLFWLTEAALGSWAKQVPLEFKRQMYPRADIQVIFAEGQHGDSYPFVRREILGHAFFPSDRWDNFLEGDIHLNAAQSWDWAKIFRVLLHEGGHAIGIGHSKDRSAIMYPYYQSSVSALGVDDIRAVQALYGAR